MRKIGNWAGYLSLAAFALFFANIVAGAFYRTSLMSDVSEMLLLFAASALFVVLILARERAALTRKNQS